MKAMVLAHAADVEGWRSAARRAIGRGLLPDEIVWRIAGDCGDLLAVEDTGAEPPAPQFVVPRAFIALAEHALLHSDPERFALMYRILWRLRRAPGLMKDAADADVHRADRWSHAVRRDIHKMHAFVRFKEVQTTDGPVYMAWFEPEHHVLAAAAPFFARRFAAMTWTILTPERSVFWNGTDLVYGRGGNRDMVPTSDRLDSQWRTYYASIFNPARLKLAAMTKEMPKKYWRNLPEAEAIAPLIRAATSRTAAMLAAPASAPSPMAAAQDRRRVTPAKPAEDLESIAGLKAAAESCRRCALWQDATQMVWGEGPSNAALMLVGEQPGDQEDLAGRPFVGPAGQVLDAALAAAGIDRAATYVTNAVKHFKFEPRGKRRLHKKPDAGEIAQCRWWLEHERSLIKPKLIVALGTTAAQSLLNRPVAIGRERGRAFALSEGTYVWITVHPSYLLRLPDPAARAAEERRFIADLRDARAWLDAAVAA